VSSATTTPSNEANVMSLATALMQLYGWQREWFGWSGPHAPYVKVDLRFVRGWTLLRPVGWQYRFGRSRKVLAKQLLANFGAVQFKSAAFRDLPATTRNEWFGHQGLPFDEWLPLYHYRGPTKYDLNSTDLYPVNVRTKQICCVSLSALCFGEGVYLRLGNQPYWA